MAPLGCLRPAAAQDAAAALVISDPRRGTATTVDHLRDLYDLTAAESRTALALLHGGRLEDIASRFKVSVSAVRIHLQRVFEKTDTHRQADLVRLLMAHRVPALEGSADGRVRPSAPPSPARPSTRSPAPAPR